MAKAKKRRTARRTKKTAKRGKRKIKAKKTAKRGTRKTTRKKSTVKRKRTTAEGMQRALEMKQAAEERKREEYPHSQPVQDMSPAQMAESVEPDPVSHNLREQGDVANIIQNTTNRRAG